MSTIELVLSLGERLTAGLPTLVRKVHGMSILDLIKATITFALIAFLIYSFPVLGQVLLIGFLTLLWLGYARKTIVYLRRK